jgi:hypothetical protein
MRKRTRFVVSLIWRFFKYKNRPGQTRQTRRLALSTDRTPLLPRPVDAPSLLSHRFRSVRERLARRPARATRARRLFAFRAFLVSALFCKLKIVLSTEKVQTLLTNATL